MKSGKLSPRTTFQFATGPGRRKIEFERIDPTASRVSSVVRYGYAELDGRNIEVVRDGPSKSYKVVGIGDDNALRRAAFDALFGKYLNAPFGMGGYDIKDAVSRGWFLVTEERETNIEGRVVVEVTFRLTTMAEPHYYRATFDPTLHWAIVRGSSWETDSTKLTERYEATYAPTASGRPYLKTIRWWGLDGKEKLCEFDSVEFAPTPASEFTLEHYSLKSPPLPGKKQNYLIPITLGVLGVSLMVAAWFTRRLAAG